MFFFLLEKNKITCNVSNKNKRRISLIKSVITCMVVFMVCSLNKNIRY